MSVSVVFASDCMGLTASGSFAGLWSVCASAMPAAITSAAETGSAFMRSSCDIPHNARRGQLLRPTLGNEKCPRRLLTTQSCSYDKKRMVDGPENLVLILAPFAEIFPRPRFAYGD